MEQQLMDFYTTYGNKATVVQLVVLIVVILISWALAKFYETWYLNKNQALDPTNLSKIRRLQGYRTIRRIVFPLSASLFILVSIASLKWLNFNVEFLKIILPLSLALAAIRLVVYFMRSALPGARWLSTGESFISFVIWISIALYYFGWLSKVIEILDAFGFELGDNQRLSLLFVIQLGFMLAILLLVAMWLSKVVEKRLRKSTMLDVSMRVAVSKIFKFSIVGIALMSALSIVGIDFTALAVFGGALGVGLGFGLQKIASNFVSGFILLFDRSIKPGDVITIGENFGWVEELNARYVVVRNREGVEVLIPNENLVTSEVINWSFNDKNVRLKIPVQISYDCDPEQAIEIMRQAAANSDRVLSFPRPVSHLINFGDSGINIELRVWISDPQNGIANIRSEINLRIWKAFKEAGIVIPYPHQDVSFTMPLELKDAHLE